MKPKTLVTLIALLAVFSAYVVVRHIGKTRKTDGEPTKNVFADKPDEITRITVQPADGVKMVFAKRGDDWDIVEPVQAKADKWEVNSIANAMKDLTWTRKFDPSGEDGLPDATTGLAGPLWTVTAVDKKGKSHVLQVGLAEALSNNARTYVRPPGDANTYVVGVDFLSKLKKGLSDFRSKNILDLDRDKIASVRVRGRENYTVVRREDDKWGFAPPISARADKDKVNDLLGNFTYLNAERFVTDAATDLAAFGLDEAARQLVVSITLKPEKDDQPATASAPTTKPAEPPKVYALALSAKRGDKVYGILNDKGAVFELKASKLDDMQPKLNDLRDKTVLELKADDVVALDMSLPGGRVELKKVDDTWEMAAPLKGKANASVVKDLVEKLAKLKADGFAEAVTSADVYGLASAAGAITAHLKGTDQTVGLRIGKSTASGEMTFVQAAQATSVAVVPSGAVKELLGPPAGYIDPQLQKLPFEEKVTRLEVRRPSGTLKLQREDGEWRLTSPLKAKVKTFNVDDLVNVVRELKAEKVVAFGPGADKYVKAAGAVAVIAQTLTEPPEPVSQPSTQPASGPASRPKPEPKKATRRINAVKLDDKAYGWVEGAKTPVVGQIEDSVYKKLVAPLRDLKLLDLKPDDVKSVAIRYDSTDIELIREADGWRYKADPYVKIDADKVKTYLETFDGLEADKWAAHSAPDAKKFGLDKPMVTVVVAPKKGEAVTIVVGGKVGDTDDRYATITGVAGAAVLPSSKCDKLKTELKGLKK